MSLRIDRAELQIEIQNDQSRKKLRELEDDMRNIRKEMRKFKENTPEWQALNRQLQDLNQEYDDMYNNIGLLNLSTRELRNRQRELQSILNNMSPTSPLYDQYRQQLDAVNERMRELRGTAQETGDSLSKLFSDRLGIGSMQVFLGNMLTKGIDLFSDLISKGIEFAKVGTDIAAKAEGITTAYQKLADRDLLTNLRSDTKGLVSDLVLMQSAVKAKNFDIPVERLGKLLKFAQQRAQETGESVDYLVDSIITGLGRKSVMILDNLQIKQEEIQKRVKKGGDFTNSVIDLVNEKLEEQGDLALTSADKETQTTVKRENAQLKLGKQLLFIKNIWSEISGSFFETFGNLSEKYIPRLIKSLENVINYFIDIYNSFSGVRVFVESIISLISITIDLIVSAGKTALNVVSTIATGLSAALKGDFDGAKKAVSDFSKFTVDEGKKIRENFIKNFNNITESVEKNIKPIDLSSKIITGGNTSGSVIIESDEESDDSKTDKNKASKDRQKLNDELKKIETKHLQDMEDIQRKYLSNEIETEFDFNQALLAEQDKFDAKRKEKLQELQKTITDTSLRTDILKQIADIDKKILDRQIDQANKIKKIILASDPIEAEKEAHNNRLREIGLFGKRREDLTEEQIKALDQLEKQHLENLRKLSSKEAALALKQLDTEQSEAVKQLEERRTAEKMNEQQYRDELLKIEIDYLNKRLKINGLSAEKIADINRQINKATSEGISNKGEKRESILDQFNLKSLKDQREAELEVIKYYEREGYITHEEALKIKAQLDQQYLESTIDKFSTANDTIQQVGGNLTGAMTNFQSAEEDAISRKYDRQIKAAEGNSKLQQKLEKEKEEELNKVRAEYADKQFAVQAAMIVSETAMAAMRAYSAAMSLGPVGFVLGPVMAAAAIAFGLSQLKVASEQRNAAKEGYQIGGFTPKDNRDDKPVGTVHANEFVANAGAVRNPSVRKFLDVFDMAQKNGTIHMLNTTQILEKVRYETNNGYQSGGFTSPSAATNNIDTSILMNIIENNTIAMNRMRDKLDEGIEAYSVISGDNGSYRQTQRYEGLLKNATRRQI